MFHYEEIVDIFKVSGPGSRHSVPDRRPNKMHESVGKLGMNQEWDATRQTNADKVVRPSPHRATKILVTLPPQCLSNDSSLSKTTLDEYALRVASDQSSSSFVLCLFAQLSLGEFWHPAFQDIARRAVDRFCKELVALHLVACRQP